MKLLIFLYALSRTEIKLRTAIGTVEQARKQTLSARSGVSSASITQFLNAVEGILINNSFLGIRNDLPFFFRVVNRLVYLVAYERGFEIDRASRVLSIL